MKFKNIDDALNCIKQINIHKIFRFNKNWQND